MNEKNQGNKANALIALLVASSLFVVGISGFVSSVAAQNNTVTSGNITGTQVNPGAANTTNATMSPQSSMAQSGVSQLTVGNQTTAAK